MIKKPQGYDEAAAYTGEFQALPKGKYVCKIRQVAEVTDTDKSGHEWRKFVILYDIAEGEYADFYDKQFKAEKETNPKAKWRGVFKQNMDDKGTPWLKGVVTAIERSNNFTFQWDKEENEKTLVNKKFGGIFRRRQYEKDNGERAMTTELWRIRSVAGLAEAEVPEDELLPVTGPGGGRPNPADAAAPPSFTDSDGFMNIPEGTGDEGIPFM